MYRATEIGKLTHVIKNANYYKILKGNVLCPIRYANENAINFSSIYQNGSKLPQQQNHHQQQQQQLQQQQNRNLMNTTQSNRNVKRVSAEFLNLLTTHDNNRLQEKLTRNMHHEGTSATLRAISLPSRGSRCNLQEKVEQFRQFKSGSSITAKTFDELNLKNANKVTTNNNNNNDMNNIVNKPTSTTTFTIETITNVNTTQRTKDPTTKTISNEPMKNMSNIGTKTVFTKSDANKANTTTATIPISNSTNNSNNVAAAANAKKSFYTNSIIGKALNATTTTAENIINSVTNKSANITKTNNIENTKNPMTAFSSTNKTDTAPKARTVSETSPVCKTPFNVTNTQTTKPTNNQPSTANQVVSNTAPKGTSTIIQGSPKATTSVITSKATPMTSTTKTLPKTEIFQQPKADTKATSCATETPRSAPIANATNVLKTDQATTKNPQNAISPLEPTKKYRKHDPYINDNLVQKVMRALGPPQHCTSVQWPPGSIKRQALEKTTNDAETNQTKNKVDDLLPRSIKGSITMTADAFGNIYVKRNKSTLASLVHSMEHPTPSLPISITCDINNFRESWPSRKLFQKANELNEKVPNSDVWINTEHDGLNSSDLNLNADEKTTNSKTHRRRRNSSGNRRRNVRQPKKTPSSRTAIRKMSRTQELILLRRKQIREELKHKAAGLHLYKTSEQLVQNTNRDCSILAGLQYNHQIANEAVPQRPKPQVKRPQRKTIMQMYGFHNTQQILDEPLIREEPELSKRQLTQDTHEDIRELKDRLRQTITRQTATQRIIPYTIPQHFRDAENLKGVEFNTAPYEAVVNELRGGLEFDSNAQHRLQSSRLNRPTHAKAKQRDAAAQAATAYREYYLSTENRRRLKTRPIRTYKPCKPIKSNKTNKQWMNIKKYYNKVYGTTFDGNSPYSMTEKDDNDSNAIKKKSPEYTLADIQKLLNDQKYMLGHNETATAATVAAAEASIPPSPKVQNLRKAPDYQFFLNRKNSYSKYFQK